MTEHKPLPDVSVPGIPPVPPDDENPAIIDAHRTFLFTIIGTAAFVGVVIAFIL